MQSSLRISNPAGLHVGLIMDGSGRWAAQRGWPRTAGHRAGARTVRQLVLAAPALGVGTLTLFAFSSDNWRRPPAEIKGLMGIFENFFRTEAASFAEAGVRINVIGRQDRLPRALRAAIESVERETHDGSRLLLRLAIDYSARETLRQAALQFWGADGTGPDAFALVLSRVMHAEPSSPPVDMIIRTGGEQRLSDFLLWESAYAEFFFTRVLWPDFKVEDLKCMVEEFHARQRRFGRLPESAAV
ncbi:MAG: di-trans,poly-cis-decaprenylcistransferase [Acidobacteriia bacterium]|nr:di-trans,poly-cis-decaprenylcistransferase [Terriglobia bacterium]